jgi:hypothetical protein
MPLQQPEKYDEGDQHPTEVRQYFRSVVDELFDKCWLQKIDGPIRGWEDINVSSMLHLISPLSVGGGYRGYHIVYKAYDFVEREKREGIVFCQNRETGGKKYRTTTSINHHYVLYENQPGVFMQKVIDGRLQNLTTLEGKIDKSVNEQYTNNRPMNQFTKDLADLSLSHAVKPQTVQIPKFLKYSDTLALIQNTNRE